jgi:hypothetical protein
VRSSRRNLWGFRDGFSWSRGGKHSIAVSRHGTKRAVLRFAIGRCEGTLWCPLLEAC